MKNEFGIKNLNNKHENSKIIVSTPYNLIILRKNFLEQIKEKNFKLHINSKTKVSTSYYQIFKKKLYGKIKERNFEVNIQKI